METTTQIEISPQDFEVSADLKMDCAVLASKLHYYGDLLVEEEDKLERMELQYKQLEAEAELRIRDDKTIKITEGLVKAKLAADNALNARQESIITQKKTVATLKNAIYALNKKDTQLTNLVKLECNKLYNSDNTADATADKVCMQLNSKRINNNS